ncbi:putative cardiolipin synthetase [Staphylococcus condimenti]|nr:putative cardiolipin synthetase [Staphylococcus condimenti]
MGYSKNVASLLASGVKIYHYENGFLHSKMMVIDDEVASVGTTNMDHRSFTLNFEVNAFIYDQSTAIQLSEQFNKDLEKSAQFTIEKYENRSLWVKFKEGISYLISPIL